MTLLPAKISAVVTVLPGLSSCRTISPNTIVLVARNHKTKASWTQQLHLIDKPGILKPTAAIFFELLANLHKEGETNLFAGKITRESMTDAQQDSGDKEEGGDSYTDARKTYVSRWLA